MTQKHIENENEKIVKAIEEKLVNRMVDRFLGWRLPETFHPDCGISFEPVSSKGTEYEGKHEPTGTNLFTAQEAREMFRFVLEDEAGRSLLAQAITAAEERERERIKSVIQEAIKNTQTIQDFSVRLFYIIIQTLTPSTKTDKQTP